MKVRLIAAAALLCLALSASAQEAAPSKTRYSVEIGTGVPPVYMDYMTTADRLAGRGLDIDKDHYFYPVATLTGVIRTGNKTEFTFMFGTSWCHHKTIQYSVFGTDPNGNPRYNLKDGSPAGWMDSCFQYSLNVNYRHLWNPQNIATFYSGIGVGYAIRLGASVLPNLTPIALRVGGDHFYGFAELTIGAHATLAHGGLGVRF